MNDIANATTPSTILPPISLAKLQLMYGLQDKMNSKVDPTWSTRPDTRPFRRAAFMESAEAIDHMAWPWWKQTESDMSEAQMEVVDIWHFIISEFILNSISPEEVLISLQQPPSLINSWYLEQQALLDEKERIIQTFELMGTITLVYNPLLADLVPMINKKDFVEIFNHLLHVIGMNWDVLFRKYIAKNVLNFFRQANGYKQGHYMKRWDGEEDNVYLNRFIDEAVEDGSIENPSFPDDLFVRLDHTYKCDIKEFEKGY